MIIADKMLDASLNETFSACTNVTKSQVKKAEEASVFVTSEGHVKALQADHMSKVHNEVPSATASSKKRRMAEIYAKSLVRKAKPFFGVGSRVCSVDMLGALAGGAILILELFTAASVEASGMADSADLFQRAEASKRSLSRHAPLTGFGHEIILCKFARMYPD